MPVCLPRVILVESGSGSSRASAKAQRIHILFSSLSGEDQRKREFPKNAPTSPKLSYPGGSVSMSGIYQGLPRWVQACLCSSGMALYNLRNVAERCLACPWWAREMDNVCFKWYTHTHTHTHTPHNPHPPLSPMPDDPLVSTLILGRGTLILSWSVAKC